MPETIILKNKDYRSFGDLSLPGVTGAFSSRSDGNMSLFYGTIKDSLNNRKNFLKGLNIGFQDLVCAKQVHSSHVQYVSKEDKGKGGLSYYSSLENPDALITDKRNLPLAIFTADCLSLFLYDAATPALGLVHAGWRSTKEGIARRAVSSMQGEFNTDIKNLYVGFGPAIRACCYEVEKKFKDFFSSGVIERNGRYYLDLAGINRRELLAAGVSPEHIFDCAICNSCRNEEFFSYRKEGKSCGRIMSVAVLR